MSLEPPAPTRPYAGLISRLAALGTDVLLLAVIEFSVRSLPTLAWEQMVVRPAPGWLSAGSAFLMVLVPWSYFTACWWLSGQTAGGRLFGIAVQLPDGRVPSFARAAGRAAIGLLLPPLWMVGLLATLWDKRRRAWHDRLFGTVVRYVGRR